jgi:hypothetical protein
MISDAWARRTAAQWHAGQSSALHMLASSGATHDRRNSWEQLRAEIDNDRRNADLLDGGGAGRGRELGDLLAYVTAVGARGPQPGWATLEWPTTEDPWVGHYTAAGAALHQEGWAVRATDPHTGADPAVGWSAELTRHGQRAAVVCGPDGGPAAWPVVEPAAWTQADHALLAHFMQDIGWAGTDPRAALTGLAYLDSLGLTEADTTSTVTGMFLYEGLRDWVERHDPHQDRIVRVGGAVEQAHLAAGYAATVATAAAIALAEDPRGRDRPGVLEYEVINPVGGWLAHRAATGPLDDHGRPATGAQVAAITRTLTRDFLTDPTTPPRMATGPAAVTTAIPAQRPGHTTRGAHR